MGNPTRRPADFKAALSRLTGDSGQRGNHITRYRVEVTTCEGEQYGLRLSAGNNAKNPKSDIGRLKRRLCLRENEIEIETVLEDWGPDDLREYVKTNLSRADMDRYGGG